MRARLLEATVELLVEQGFAGTSTTLVERAGRGQPGRPAAPLPDQERPRRRRGRSTSPRCAAPSWRRRPRACRRGAQRTRAVLQMLGDHFTSPVFTAALELWVAARTDADAARRGRAAGAAGRPRDAPADRRAARRRRVAARRTRARAGHARPGPRPRPGQHDHRRRAVAAAGSSTSGPPPSTPRWRRRMTDLLTGLLDDLDAEGDQLRGDRRAARRRRLDDAHARRRLGRRHPGRAPALDRRGRRPRRAPHDTEAKQAWDDVVLEAIADPMGFVDAAALELGRAAAATRLLARWRQPARQRCADALRGYPTGQRMPWFGPPMSADVDGDRAVHGDLGARARRRRRARRAARADRPDPARRPPRRPHPQLRVRRPRARSRRPRSSGSS